MAFVAMRRTVSSVMGFPTVLERSAHPQARWHTRGCPPCSDGSYASCFAVTKHQGHGGHRIKFQVGQEFGWWYNSLEHDKLKQFADRSIFYDREYKILGIAFGDGEELVICDFSRMVGIYLESNHICVVVWNILVITGRIGGRGNLAL